MRFKKFDVAKIANNMYTKGIVPESFQPLLKDFLVKKARTVTIVTDVDEMEDENGDWQEIETKETYAIIVLKKTVYKNRHTFLPKCDEFFPQSGFPTAQLWRLTNEGWVIEDYNHWSFLPHGEFFDAILRDNKSLLTDYWG